MMRNMSIQFLELRSMIFITLFIIENYIFLNEQVSADVGLQNVQLFGINLECWDNNTFR
jgi:hypothetical protein